MNAVNEVYEHNGIAVPGTKLRLSLAVLPGLAPVLLVVVALVQVYASHTRHLTRWKGRILECRTVSKAALLQIMSEKAFRTVADRMGHARGLSYTGTW